MVIFLLLPLFCVFLGFYLGNDSFDLIIFSVDVAAIFVIDYPKVTVLVLARVKAAIASSILVLRLARLHLTATIVIVNNRVHDLKFRAIMMSLDL